MSVTRTSGTQAGKVYGSSITTNTTVTNSTVADTAASVTFSTTAPNTNVLIEITTCYYMGALNADVAGLLLRAKVDGTAVATTGRVNKYIVSNAGSFLYEAPVTGRVVTTLASTGSHTILAQLFGLTPSSGVGGVSGTALGVTLTVTVLAS